MNISTLLSKIAFEELRILSFNFDFRTAEEIERYRRDREITVSGNDVPNPIMYFDEINFPGFIIQEVRYVEYLIIIFCFTVIVV